MKIECTWTRKDLQKYLEKKRRKTNLIFLILGICFFFYVTYYPFQDGDTDKRILWLGFALYLLVLLLFLFFVTKIFVFMKLRRNDKKTSKAYGTYHIYLDEEKIESSVDKEKISYRWKDITTHKFKKHAFFLATKKDHIGLWFREEVLKDDYDKLVQYVKERLSS